MEVGSAPLGFSAPPAAWTGGYINSPFSSPLCLSSVPLFNFSPPTPPLHPYRFRFPCLTRLLERMGRLALRTPIFGLPTALQSQTIFLCRPPYYTPISANSSRYPMFVPPTYPKLRFQFITSVRGPASLASTFSAVGL